MEMAFNMEKLKKSLNILQKRFADARSVILFFVVLFAIIVGLFGLRYAILVSVFTTIFKIRRGQPKSFGYFIQLTLSSVFLCLLAYWASLNLLFCIVLNFFVPFLLVLMQSSQFSPKGYFAYTMMFVFLELMPPDATQLSGEIIAIFVSILALLITLQFYRGLQKKPADRQAEIRNGILELANLIEKITEQDIDEETVNKIQNLEQKFHAYAYNNHRFFSLRKEDAQMYDMFAILFQRATYLITDTAWQSELSPQQIQMLQQLAAFLKKVERSDSLQEENWELLDEAQQLLDNMSLANGRIRIFSRSFLHMLILLMKKPDKPQISGLAQSFFVPISLKEKLLHIRRRCSLEAFELRFALRCAIVMTISYTASMLIPVTHSYWLPMNAFLLLQPSYEESAYRLKTRPIGTIIGCFLHALIYPYLTGTGWKLVFALLMLSCMYCAKPGTWNQPIFSTCYALTLASMTINEAVAIELRVIYLLLAIVLVFAVNRFVLPTKLETLFRFNLKRLYSLFGSYWAIITDELQKKGNLSASSEILSYFHMLYSKSVEYAAQLPLPEDKSQLRSLLLNFWQLMSELEQIKFLTQTGSFCQEEAVALFSFARSEQQRIALGYPAALEWLVDAFSDNADLSYIMGQYQTNMSKLLYTISCFQQDFPSHSLTTS